MQAYYVASSSSTEQPITNNGIDDDNSVQQVYLIKPILKSEINEQKSAIKQNYGSQRGQQHYKQLFGKNIQTTKATKIK